MTLVAAWYPILPLNLCEYKVFRLGTTASIIFDLIFLSEHYPEECHKQWLALGLISEWCLKYTNSKDCSSHFSTLVFSLKCSSWSATPIKNLGLFLSWFLGWTLYTGMPQTMVSPGPHLWVSIPSTKFKRLHLSYSTLIFLNEQYSEECHKQWLALGLISELVPQVQNSKIIPADLALRPNSSVFEIKLNILYSLDQLHIEWENLSWYIVRYSILGKFFVQT